LGRHGTRTDLVGLEGEAKGMTFFHACIVAFAVLTQGFANMKKQNAVLDFLGAKAPIFCVFAL
jgi:hypothetical protein